MSDATVSIAWRTWSADQQQAGLKLAIARLDALTADQRAALNQIAVGKSGRASHLVNGAGSVSVELWVDPAPAPRASIRTSGAP